MASPMMLLGVAALETSKIGLGTAILVAFPRSPMITAMEAWQVQKASGGRFVLGLGTQVKGHNERRFSVPFDRPGPRLREMILALRHIWKAFQGEERLSWKGEFYRFDLITPFFNPGPIEHPTIPIYIAGVNEYMCRLAGELCEGFHVHPFHSVKYLNEVVLPAISTGLASAGRKREDIQLTAPVFVCLGRDEKEIEAAKGPVRAQIAFYGATRTYKPVFNVHGWGDATAELQRLMAEGRFAEMASVIDDEMLAVYALEATYEDLVDKLKAKYSGILDRVYLYLPLPQKMPEDLELRWRAIISEMNS
ncbi:MAG: LLM class F420-dependent oxidoreductase [Acidimicrobiia bacterium]